MVKRSAGELLFGLRIDRSRALSVTSQLHHAIRDMIARGDLMPGRRLPSSRTLAVELNVSRSTTIAVYDRLVSEGLLDSRQGSGSYVSAQGVSARPALRPTEEPGGGAGPSVAPVLSEAIREASRRFTPRLPHPRQPRAFVTGMPDSDAFPLAVWARLTARYWRGARDEILGYPEPAGEMRLRQAISDHLRINRGITCSPDQVFVTAGAQQAFDLIARVLLNPGDRVWFEEPGAIGARNSLIAAGAQLVPVPVDEEGLIVSEGLRVSPEFRLAFVTPSHQHPTGAEMSLPRREALLAAAEAAGGWIIEDDYDGEFRYDGRPLPTLKSADRAGRVIYVGTFSKSLFPSLRLGFYIAPPALTPVFDAVSRAFLQGVSHENQSVLAGFMEEGHFATHLRRMRDIYAERHEAFHSEAQLRLAGLMAFRPSAAGFHVIGRFCNPGIREAKLVAAAAEAGLTLAAQGAFYASDMPRDQGLVLGVTAVPVPALRRGIAQLAQIITAQSGGG